MLVLGPLAGFTGRDPRESVAGELQMFAREQQVPGRAAQGSESRGNGEQEPALSSVPLHTRHSWSTFLGL